MPLKTLLVKWKNYQDRDKVYPEPTSKIWWRSLWWFLFYIFSDTSTRASDLDEFLCLIQRVFKTFTLPKGRVETYRQRVVANFCGSRVRIAHGTLVERMGNLYKLHKKVAGCSVFFRNFRHQLEVCKQSIVGCDPDSGAVGC